MATFCWWLEGSFCRNYVSRLLIDGSLPYAILRMKGAALDQAHVPEHVLTTLQWQMMTHGDLEHVQGYDFVMSAL